MRVALVHDWLETWGGGEAVLAELLLAFPGADVHTLVDFLPPEDRARLGSARIVDVVAAASARRAALVPLCGGAAPAAHRALRPRRLRCRDLRFARRRKRRAHARRPGPRLLLPHAGALRVDDGGHLCRPRHRRRRVAAPAGHARAGTLPPLGSSPRARASTASSPTRVTSPRRSRAATVAKPKSSIRRSTSSASHRAGNERDAGSPRRDYVTVSRLVPYKRVDVLVEAFRAVAGPPAGRDRRRPGACAPAGACRAQRRVRRPAGRRRHGAPGRRTRVHSSSPPRRTSASRRSRRRPPARR